MADGALAQEFQLKVEFLRSLLKKNGAALRLMADLEADLDFYARGSDDMRCRVRRIVDETQLMAQELNRLTGGRYKALHSVLHEIWGRIRQEMDTEADGAPRLACGLDDEAALDALLVGGKASALARLRARMPEAVPDGFVLTTDAWRAVLRHNRLEEKLGPLMRDFVSVRDPHQRRSRVGAMRAAILGARLPDAVGDALLDWSRIGHGLWAVRSSAVSEDGRLSFAGQFDSRLQVPADGLGRAYLEVLASRFSERAISYRFQHGVREGAAAMAVLFMPMVDPTAAGVLYTSDPAGRHPQGMVVSAVAGLADGLVRGEAQGELIMLPSAAPLPAFLSQAVASELEGLARDARELFGYELDMEWAADEAGRVRLLQARPLRAVEAAEAAGDVDARPETPLAEGGFTLSPGRAEGPVERMEPGRPWRTQRESPVLVAREGRPEMTPVLPGLAALLLADGNPVSHLATLARELGIPCVYRLGAQTDLLRDGETVSVDATTRRIFRGSRWPACRERTLARTSQGGDRSRSGPLRDLVLSLNLTDPFRQKFQAKSCRSVHDVIRLIHEMSVRAMFSLGDQRSRPWRRKPALLDSQLPFKVRVLDLDGCASASGRVRPEEIASRPFEAFWRGVADPRVSWAARPMPEMAGMPADFAEQVLGGSRGPRRPHSPNYMVVARDYLNLNARLAYQYVMVEAVVGRQRENNRVHFRHRGGGASGDRRRRAARFLETVLRRSGFEVDRHDELVNAWLRDYPPAECDESLGLLGRLLACARQIDTTLSSDQVVNWLVDRFLIEAYDSFA